MSNIIKNVAVLALINSVQAHKISQSANIGVRFIEQPKPEDSNNLMIQDPTVMVQKSAQDKLFDQMDKEETEESTGQSLEQTKSMQKENLNADQKSQVDQNKAYRSFVDANAKPVPESAPIAVVEKKAVQASQATSVPKPTVGHFREQENILSQAEQDKNTAHNLVQAATMRTGGDKADPEYQLAIAEAMKSQDGAIIDKQLSGIDTDAENDAAIEKTLGNIVTDSEKDENVKKDAQKQKDLQYMAENGSPQEKAMAQSEMNKGSIMGDSTSVVFDPVTATMHVQNSNKPMLNNLAEKKSMEVHNNVPKAILAPGHVEQISAAQAGILKYAVGAYPKDNITEIDE